MRQTIGKWGGSDAPTSSGQHSEDIRSLLTPVAGMRKGAKLERLARDFKLQTQLRSPGKQHNPTTKHLILPVPFLNQISLWASFVNIYHEDLLYDRGAIPTFSIRDTTGSMDTSSAAAAPVPDSASA